METVGGVVSAVELLSVTVTAREVVRFPAASRAMAVSVCEPFDAVVVFHEFEYGEAVSSAPRLAPSSCNWTPATPTLSDALADTVVVPETVEPPVGLVIETVGGVVSAVELLTVTVTALEVVRFPAASRAMAVSVCEAFDAVVVFHEIEYGEAVSSAPRLAPSSCNWTPATPTLSEAFADTVTVPEAVDPFEIGRASCRECV